MSDNTSDYVIYLTDAEPWAAVNKAVEAAMAAAAAAEINAAWAEQADNSCYNCGARGWDDCYACDCEWL